MNEVSNGANGNKEYVEFVVASNTVSYTCSNTTPPCIDIRGWIFDDNSGLHGGTSGTGVAAGAIRFSQNSIWACVPLGTIILIYNDADKNPAIPADDISMADGNCKIIAPISNTSLFESNATTPGAVACSYPLTGWTPGGDWTNTLLANSGDCARIVNLAGCEVFSVCYGAANTNNLIYFSGTGGQTVFYFNNGNPNIQSNWSSGSASPSPGNQTPGTANNAANASYISQFNNSCMPITPIAIGTASVTNAGCICNGSATVSASGSIGGYTYAWYDANSNSIGQTAATATALCAGAYKVVSTSHIGCKDSTNIIITSFSNPSITVNSQTICPGGSATLTATPDATGGTYLWAPDGQTTQSIVVSPSSSTSYSVTYTIGSCNTTKTLTVNVSTSTAPTLSVASSVLNLCSSGQTATLTLTGSSGTYSWSNGATSSSVTINTPGIYTATVTTSSCGTATASITIGAISLPTVSISAPSTSVCVGSALTFTANSSETNYLWNGGATTQTISVSSSSVIVTSTNACGSAQATQTLDIVPLPTVTVSPNVITLCSGQTATVQANVNTAVTYSWSTGATTNSVSLNAAGIYTVNAFNACGNASATVNVSISSAPTLSIVSSAVTICPSGQTATLSLLGSVGTYSWSTGANTSTTTINSPGVYSASVTTGACGIAVANISLGSAPLPIVSISSPITTTLCSSGSVTLTATSNEGNYLWSNGATTNTVSVNSPTVTVTSTNSCGSSQATQTLNVITPPTVSINASSLILCPGSVVTLTANASNASNYLWSSGAVTNTISVNTIGVKTVTVTNVCGTAVASTTISSVSFPPLILTSSSNTICPNETATLTVTGGTIPYVWSNSASTGSVVTTNGGVVTVSNVNACGTNTASILVTVLNINADVIANPTSGTLPVVVSFTNNSTNANSYSWNFGNGNSASTTTVSSQTYSNPGTYTVYLTALNGACADVDYVVITVLNVESTLYVPNAFTPNGDSINDIFLVGATNIKEFNIIIFDRWGLKMFESSDIKIGWDGTVHGKIVADGTYFHLINAKDVDGIEIKKQGTITLFK